MMRYQRVSGVQLKNSNGLPTITRTPEGEAMGGIPDWVALIDPAYVDQANKTVRNRVIARTNAPVTNLPMGSFPNTQPAFYPTEGGANSLQVNPGGDINPNAYTVFAVLMPEPNETGSRQLISYSFGNGSTPQKIRLGASVSASGNILSFVDSFGVNGIRLATKDIGLTARVVPTLAMWTFSTEAGLAIFDNGKKVASAPGDKRPLDEGYRSGEWRMFANGRGRFGMCGVLNIDLSLQENAGHRLAIERFMAKKYGIPME